MPTIEESAAAFRAGYRFFCWYPKVPLELWDNARDRQYFTALDVSLRTAPDDFRDGWRSAQREAEIERHAEQAAT